EPRDEVAHPRVGEALGDDLDRAAPPDRLIPRVVGLAGRVERAGVPPAVGFRQSVLPLLQELDVRRAVVTRPTADLACRGITVAPHHDRLAVPGRHDGGGIRVYVE